MSNINVTIRINEDLKEEADSLFEELGMSFTTAVNVFAKQAVREGRIPFEVTTSSSYAVHAAQYQYENAAIDDGSRAR